VSFPKPIYKNSIILPRQIPKRLRPYKEMLPCKSSKFLKNTLIPETQSGGISATAMAIPATEASTSGLAYAYAPAIPLRRAIKKNNMFGTALDEISAVSVTVFGSMRNTRAVVIIVTQKPKVDPEIKRNAVLYIRRTLLVISEREKPKIGVISGATTIAPIIMAVLFNKSPIVAIAEERVISRKKVPLFCS